MKSREISISRGQECDSSSCSEPLNLADINDDCKILIFTFLDWTDLINVAETSNKLQKAACDVYRRKYGKGRLCIVDDFSSYVPPRNVDVYEPGKALKILRNFGHLVSYIYLRPKTYDYPSTFVFLFESYVAEYCSKTLRQFILVCPPKFLFKEIRNSFINVEHINLDHYRAPISEFPFSSTFPNLKSLELQLGWYGPTPIAFPSVKKLCIDAWKCEKNENKGLHFEANEINGLLRLNPQLEELELNYNGISDTIFQDINLPKLKRFLPRMRYYPDIKNADRYHFENVIDFRFDIFHDDFIDENKHLKSIILTGVRDGMDSLLQQVSVLPNIEELRVEVRARPVPSNFDLIPNLFSQNKSFKKFTLWGWQKYLGNLISKTDSAKFKNFKQETEFVRYTTTLTWTQP